MKILHICLGSSFTEGLTYQENYLIKENLKDGHKVFVITNDTYFEDGKLIKSEKVGQIEQIEDNYSMIRLPFVDIPYKNKIRKVHSLYPLIKDYIPDIILFHGICSIELLTCKKYVKNNPNCRLLVDSHAYDLNSGTTFISKYVLHKIIYRTIYKLCDTFIEKILYIDSKCLAFMIDNYHIDQSKCYKFPLGGKVLENQAYLLLRNEYRKKIGVDDTQIVIFHSGKMDKLKKTIELLKAFKESKRDDMCLIIAGTFCIDIKEEALKIINSDDNINYVGWANKDELNGYICACDLYAQPGSTSATCQVALCNRCPCMLFPHDAYMNQFESNAFYVKNETEIINLLSFINHKQLKDMKSKVYQFAKENLDYNSIVKQMYEEV